MAQLPMLEAPWQGAYNLKAQPRLAACSDQPPLSRR
jgi:hypothetical protein